MVSVLIAALTNPKKLELGPMINGKLPNMTTKKLTPQGQKSIGDCHHHLKHALEYLERFQDDVEIVFLVWAMGFIQDAKSELQNILELHCETQYLERK